MHHLLEGEPEMNGNGRSELTQSFRLRDCALVSMATGLTAQNLREFKDCLERVHEGSIYHHFWGRFLQPQFDEPEYNNDFAAWVYHGLHEKALAERLSVLDPTEFEDIEQLRQELLDRVEDYLYEKEMVPWSMADQQLHFVRSQIVVLDTGISLDHPAQLTDVLDSLSLGSIFYHFIDARKRTHDRSDDFSSWLVGWGEKYEDLRQEILALDPYFSSLKELRWILSTLFKDYFKERSGE